MTGVPQQLLARSDGPVRILTLHRPERRNALSASLLRELQEALDAADADQAVRGVVLTGSGSGFCAGADLREAVEVEEPTSALRYVAGLRHVTTSVERLSKPVVAAIAGFCLTGGLELALACDYRIASPDSTFAITSARIGSVPGMGATQRLPRVIGLSRAKDMLLRARVVGGDEALAIGLVDELRDGTDVVAAAVRWVEDCAEQAPASVWLAKLAVNESAETSLTAGLQLEAALSALAFGTEDKREGMNAVLAKRKPDFRGR